MVCSQCGVKLEEGVFFCSQCGAKVNKNVSELDTPKAETASPEAEQAASATEPETASVTETAASVAEPAASVTEQAAASGVSAAAFPATLVQFVMKLPKAALFAVGGGALFIAAAVVTAVLVSQPGLPKGPLPEGTFFCVDLDGPLKLAKESALRAVRSYTMNCNGLRRGRPAQAGTAASRRVTTLCPTRRTATGRTI
jgi:hypothetical protein